MSSGRAGAEVLGSSWAERTSPAGNCAGLANGGSPAAQIKALVVQPLRTRAAAKDTSPPSFQQAAGVLANAPVDEAQRATLLIVRIVSGHVLGRVTPSPPPSRSPTVIRAVLVDQFDREAHRA